MLVGPLFVCVFAVYQFVLRTSHTCENAGTIRSTYSTGGTPSGIRTHNKPGLSRPPLPVGLSGLRVCEFHNRAAEQTDQTEEYDNE